MFDFLTSFTGFEKILFYIAVPFSALTVIQLVLQFVGGGHEMSTLHTDMTAPDLSHGDVPGFSVFTLSSMFYFLTLFGWAGLAASRAGASIGLTLIVALVAGVLTALLIGYIFFSLNKLAESGNVKLANALGMTCSVYLPIPAKRSGTGLVQGIIQGATIEASAMTDGDAIKTGRSVKIVQMLDGNMVLVEGT
jgi:hypothetical protein